MNRPVNLWIQMTLVFVGAIVGPTFRIVETMDFVRDVLVFSSFTMMIPYVFIGISIIPFALIKKLKYGMIVFLYLYLATMIIFYFVGSYVAAFAQNAGIDQLSGAYIGIVTTLGVYAIIGIVIMYFVAKWSDAWNRKFITA